MDGKEANTGYERIENKSSYGISYYEHGEAYHGSHHGMRFRIERSPLEDVFFRKPEEKGDARFVATVWPEPFSFDKTEDDKKVSKDFPFDEKGKEEMVEWLNEQFFGRIEEWEAVAFKL